MSAERSKISSALESLNHNERFYYEEMRQIATVCYQGELLPFRAEIFEQFDSPPSPNIEIGGAPKTGKTSALKWTIGLLAKKGIEVEFLPESRPLFMSEDSPELYSLAMFTKVATPLIEHSLDTSKKLFPLLLDRGVLDRIAFLDAFGSIRVMGTEDVEIAARFIARFFGAYIDALVLCHAPTETILERGSKMEREFLDALQPALKNLPKRIAQLRNETLLGNHPLMIAEITNDSLRDWDDFLNIFSKTVNSIIYWYDASSR